MGMLCFFPWLHLKEPVSVSGFDLIPVHRGESALGLSAQDKNAIDLLLEPYVDRTLEPVATFAVIRLDGKGWLDELNDAERGEMFDLAEILAFSSLAIRDFFPESGVGQYSNRTHFQLYIQRFVDPERGVAAETRRRDGTNLSGFSKGKYRIQRPEHVVNTSEAPFDLIFLEALLSSRSEEWWPPMWEGILAYNIANTDSNEIRSSLELVMLNGAFERVFDLSYGRAKDLEAALLSTLNPTERKQLADCPRTAPRLAAGNTPKGEGVAGAWVYDLFDVRNDLAHGKASTQGQPIWEVHEHLLLGSVLFPLVVKLMLALRGKYELTEPDLELIDAFEALACEDLFRPPKEDADGIPQEPWAWNRVISEARQKRLNARIIERLEAAEQDEEPPPDGSLGERAL